MDAAVTVQPALGKANQASAQSNLDGLTNQTIGQHELRGNSVRGNSAGNGTVASGYRKTESPKLWNRSPRVYCEPGRCDAWFFQTREGVDVGPYVSQFAAEVEASLLKEQLAQEACQDARIARIDSFLQESLELELALS